MDTEPQREWLRGLEKSGKSLKIQLPTETPFVKSERPPDLAKVAF
jgi:hypothetical protein